MTVKEIMAQLEKKAPVLYAENWDNVGLLVGSTEKNVRKIMLALDATDAVVKQAVENKVDLLITHHPMIFTAVKKITDQDFVGRRVIKLIQHDISYYAMHTNCDVCVMNDVAAERIGLCDGSVLEPTRQNEKGDWIGIGKVGRLSKTISAGELAEVVRKAFHVEKIRLTGAKETPITRAAISTGAGKSMVKWAIQNQAQILITGDIDHHTAIDALAQGVQIIDAGHFGTEHFMTEYVKTYLKQENGEQIQIIIAQEKEPFTTIG